MPKDVSGKISFTSPSTTALCIGTCNAFAMQFCATLTARYCAWCDVSDALRHDRFLSTPRAIGGYYKGLMCNVTTAKKCHVAQKSRPRLTCSGAKEEAPLHIHIGIVHFSLRTLKIFAEVCSQQPLATRLLSIGPTRIVAST